MKDYDDYNLDIEYSEAEYSEAQDRYFYSYLKSCHVMGLAQY